MDPKQKMIFGVVAGVCGVVIAALAVLLFNQIGACGEAKDARESAVDELRGYYSQSPYPSKANREIRAQDEVAYAAVSEAAKALLAKSLTYPQDESPSQFVTRVADTIHALEERKNTMRASVIESVAKGTSAKDAVPLDYSFGRYVVQGELPKETDVPRLAKQFAVIEHVCDVLLQAGALDITQVTREMFDVSTEAPKKEETKRNRRTSRNAKKEQAVVATTGVVVPEVLQADGVTAEAFSITFRANYAALAKAMNALNTDDLFIVVTDLAFSNSLDLRTRAADMVKRRQSARTSAARRARGRNNEEAAAPEPEGALFENAKPEERLLTDPENANPLDITLKFEVYSVPPAEEPEAEATAVAE